MRRLQISNVWLGTCCSVSAITMILASQPAAAKAINESSAGLSIGILMPNYGDFLTTATSQSEPGFPAKVVAQGGHVSFAKHGFVTGGRIWTASTQSEGDTSGSHYSTSSFGLFTGTGLQMGILDITITAMLGYGTTTFATATASGGSVVEVDFLSIEPAFTLGFAVSSAFKVSFGYVYQYGIPRRVTQYGTAILASPDDAPLGGSAGLIMISFGDFR